MAYDAYGGGRPYGGPSAPRGRGGRGEPPPQAHYGTAQQQYDGYNDGYGYDQGYDQNAGYQQGYDDPYQQGGYSHGQPPRQHQDYYEPPPPGRGGRPGPGPDPRGGQPPRGRGGMRPPDQGPGQGRGMGRRPVPGGHPGQGGRPPPGHEAPISPRAQGFGGDPYARRGDMDHMTDQMSNMRMNGHGGRDPRAQTDHRGSYDDYGQPPVSGPPQGQQQGYFDPRSGLPQRQQEQRQGGYDGHNGGYGGRPPPQRPGHDFAPPGRSMTMPNNPTTGPDRAPQRVMSYEDPGMQRGPPADYHQNHQNHQPDYAPQQHHQQEYGYNQYGGGHENAQGYAPPQRGSYDDGYGQQYDQGRGSHQEPSNHQRMESQSSLPDFDMITTNNRDSFAQTMKPGIETPQPGAHQKAQLNHAKSQPDLRQPQTAIFEMAGDIPSVPPVPPVNLPPSRQGHRDNYGGQGGPAAYDRPPLRNPSAPPGPMNVPAPSPMGPPSGAASMRSEPPPRNPDALPSHPTPVRAGLMNDSVVNLNSKPPPVRNYGGVPSAPTPQPQRMQQQQPPQAQAPPPQSRVVQQKPPETPVTPQELEHLRMVIKNNPKDEESALRLAKRLIEAADTLLPNVPDPKVRGRARERYVMDAHKILKKLANAQNVGAMFAMADALGRGMFGGDSDTKEAFTLYQSAAKLGHAGAAYRTAVCCEIGHEEGGGTRKDPLKAIQWYKRAAALGDTPAMYKVGMILLKGLLGQPKNPREAVSWLKRAAERADPDNPHALHELGLLYESAKPSDTIIRDEAYAMSLFQQAADMGYKFSQFRLGQAYEYGSNGCPVDPRMSIMWYSKAAQREEHQAELALSGWYLTGSEGVLKQSDQEAYLWARKAAVAGLAKAEYAMGYFTEVGIGVPANLEDAKRWYWRAAAQEFPKARERLEDLKRGRGGGAGRPERISRSKIERQQEGECAVM